MQSLPYSIFTKSACLEKLMSWKKSHSNRQNIIKELLITQDDYVSFLSFMTTEMRSIFEEIGFGIRLYNEIFESIPELFELHKQILCSFKILQQEKKVPGFILSAYFDRYIPYFRVYHKYFSTLDKRKHILNSYLTKQIKSLLSQTLKKYSKMTEIQNKYPSKFLQYIIRIQFIDILNKPFQRYHQYSLLLSSYQKQLPEFNIQKDVVVIILESLKSDISQLDQNFSQTMKGMLLELDKKYGNILKTNHTYYQQTIVGYYSEGKIMEGKLFLFNTMLLLVQEEGKEIKRITLGQNSWFHNLKYGNNRTNSIFIKGNNTHQIVLLLDKNQKQCVGLLQKIFDQIQFRTSWTKGVMGGDSKEESFVFKPLSVYLQNNRYIFVVFIKVASAQKGIRNFYSLNQLKNIVQYLNQTKISASTKSQKQYKNDQDLNDEEAQQIALGLFQYLIPMLKDVRVCQGYTQLQSVLKIVQYMSWISNERQIVDDIMSQWLIGGQERLRLKSRISVDFVTISIWIDSIHQKQIRIGKTQRTYQIVQRLIGSSSFQFTIAIGKQLFSALVLDDDQILYECLKNQGQKFQQESNILSKGFNALFGKQQQNLNVYLRKYLYIELHNPAMYIESSQTKLSLLARDYLDKSIAFFSKLQRIKQIQLIALLARPMKSKQLIVSFINKIYKNLSQFDSIKQSLFQQIQELKDIPEIQCFKAALRKTDTLGANKFIIDCRVNNLRQCKLLISYQFLQIKQSLTSQDNILKIHFDELIFNVTPTIIHISTPTSEYDISVNGTYGIGIIIDRHIHIYNTWSKN